MSGDEVARRGAEQQVKRSQKGPGLKYEKSSPLTYFKGYSHLWKMSNTYARNTTR